MKDSKTATAKVLSARLEIERPSALSYNSEDYARVAAPEINWQDELQMLRALDFGANDARAIAARLLSGCGFVPVIKQGIGQRRRARWSAEGIDADLLARLESLQKAARAFDKEKAAESAAALRAARTKRRALGVSEIEKKMVNYLKAQRADVPPEEGPLKLLPALFKAVAYAASAAGESFERVMQRIAPGTPLPELKTSAPHPDAVLRHLLNFITTNHDWIETRLWFDKDGLPVVRVAPREPVAALLLRTHEARSLREETWAECAWCGKQFVKKRRDQTCCKLPCKNNLKVSRYRTRKAQQTKTTEREASNHGL